VVGGPLIDATTWPPKARVSCKPSPSEEREALPSVLRNELDDFYPHRSGAFGLPGYDNVETALEALPSGWRNSDLVDSAATADEAVDAAELVDVLAEA